MSTNSRKFDYETIDELKVEIENRNLKIPLSEDIEILREALSIGSSKAPNRLVANPMEGNDANKDGGPSVLTNRRYRRLAAGGSGVIWVEATAVTKKGKSSERQLYLDKNSAPDFQELVSEIRRYSVGPTGKSQDPYVVLQLNHSGRHSSPDGSPEPVIAHHVDILDAKYDVIDSDYPAISDGELEELQSNYVKAASLAEKAGFDAVDVKACHGYLIHELLTSYNRENSRYGGKRLEDRARFLLEVVSSIREETSDLDITPRINVYDHLPYPAGFGVKKDGSLDRDFTEPSQLIDELESLGIHTVNLGITNPYYEPYIERPYDTPVPGGKLPEEHPLKTIQRNIEITKKISKLRPEVNFIATGFSWLREYFPHLSASLCETGVVGGIGVGRISLADPDYSNQLFSNGYLKRDNLCTTCSSCVQMLRNGDEVGCLTRDAEMYRSSYKRSLN